MLRQHRLSDLTDDGKSQPGGVIALRGQKRADQLALIDADQIARLALVKPNANVRERLKRGSKPALGTPCPPRHTAKPAGGPAEKTYQAIPLAQRITAKDDCLRFLQWHLRVGAPTFPVNSSHKWRVKDSNKLTYHSEAVEANPKRIANQVRSHCKRSEERRVGKESRARSSREHK